MSPRHRILACDLRNRRYVVAAGAAAVVIIVIIVVVVVVVVVDVVVDVVGVVVAIVVDVVVVVVVVVVVGVAVVVAVVVVIVDFVAVGVVAPSWMSFSANAYMVASAHAVFDDRFTSLLLGTRGVGCQDTAGPPVVSNPTAKAE